MAWYSIDKILIVTEDVEQYWRALGTHYAIDSPSTDYLEPRFRFF